MKSNLLLKQNNSLAKPVFHNKQYPIIGALSLEQLLSSFILDCRFKNGQLISLLVQIRTANDVNYTLGPRTALNVSNSEDIKSYLATLHDFFNRLDTHYKSVSSVAVNFNYSLLTEDRYTIMKSRTEANKKEQELFTNIITLDIETYLQDNVHVPYLICMFDGRNDYVYHIKDYESLDLLFEQLFKDLVRLDYDGYNVYIHNSSRFDIIFMLKYIVKYCKADLIYKNNKFISVKLEKPISKKEKITINMFDSYLILLSSLSSLGKTFNVDVQKSTFPHKFINKETLDYIGNTPSIENFYFKDKNEMNDIINYIDSQPNNFLWVCKTESINYCINDCISLHQIVSKFSELIYEKFRLNIKNNPTLPSIAMKNYITNYMPTEEVTITKIDKYGEETTVTKHISNIPQLPKDIYDKIKPSYYGGLKTQRCIHPSVY